MKKIWNFIKEVWNCYTSKNSLMYGGASNIQVSTLTAIFVEYFCAGYMLSIFIVLIFTLIFSLVQTGFNISLFIFLMALIGFLTTTIVTIKNKWKEYYNSVINGFDAFLKDIGIKKNKLEIIQEEEIKSE